MIPSFIPPFIHLFKICLLGIYHVSGTVQSPGVQRNKKKVVLDLGNPLSLLLEEFEGQVRAREAL